MKFDKLKFVVLLYWRGSALAFPLGGAMGAPPVAGKATGASGSGRNFVSEQRTGNFGHRNRNGGTANAVTEEVYRQYVAVFVGCGLFRRLASCKIPDFMI